MPKIPTTIKVYHKQVTSNGTTGIDAARFIGPFQKDDFFTAVKAKVTAELVERGRKADQSTIVNILNEIFSTHPYLLSQYELEYGHRQKRLHPHYDPYGNPTVRWFYHVSITEHLIQDIECHLSRRAARPPFLTYDHCRSIKRQYAKFPHLLAKHSIKLDEVISYISKCYRSNLYIAINSILQNPSGDRSLSTPLEQRAILIRVLCRGQNQMEAATLYKELPDRGDVALRYREAISNLLAWTKSNRPRNNIAPTADTREILRWCRFLSEFVDAHYHSKSSVAKTNGEEDFSHDLLKWPNSFIKSLLIAYVVSVHNWITAYPLHHARHTIQSIRHLHTGDCQPRDRQRNQGSIDALAMSPSTPRRRPPYGDVDGSPIPKRLVEAGLPSFLSDVIENSIRAASIIGEYLRRGCSARPFPALNPVHINQAYADYERRQPHSMASMSGDLPCSHDLLTSLMALSNDILIQFPDGRQYYKYVIHFNPNDMIDIVCRPSGITDVYLKWKFQMSISILSALTSSLIDPHAYPIIAHLQHLRRQELDRLFYPDLTPPPSDQPATFNAVLFLMKTLCVAAKSMTLNVQPIINLPSAAFGSKHPWTDTNYSDIPLHSLFFPIRTAIMNYGLVTPDRDFPIVPMSSITDSTNPTSEPEATDDLWRLFDTLGMDAEPPPPDHPITPGQ